MTWRPVHGIQEIFLNHWNYLQKFSVMVQIAFLQNDHITHHEILIAVHGLKW